jgi:hypothetical protein
LDREIIMFTKQRVRSALLSTLVVFLLVLTSVSAAGASGAYSPASCDEAPRFDGRNFTHPIKINNKWMPLVPGTQFVYEGFITPPGGGSTPVDHQVIFTVTDLTKVIDGVRTRVMYDVDVNEGEVVEAELAFFAQDEDGNVWNLGEYPESTRVESLSGPQYLDHR